MSSENWLHFSTQAPKRKRAELVCVNCHSKKIKCDIQARRRNGREDCSRCSAAQQSCNIRPSRRQKRRKARVDGNTTNANRVEPSSPLISTDLETFGVDDAGFPVLAQVDHPDGSTTSSHLRQSQTTPFSIDSAHDERFPQYAPASGALDVAQNHISPVPEVHEMSASQPDTSIARNGDMDAGFLQVYGPETQFDAESQALVAQLEHRYSHELHPDLHQIFSEVYFNFCYTWSPVLDRNTLSAEIARSPLLANALALASSHIQPPLLPHDGPESYYKKARKIFYEDEEADEMTTLKALCLFYWWAPNAPSRVHRHSSWWWTSVVIRHAQQMNIHREPAKDDLNRSRLELGLRRRIWWTAFARERLTALCQSKPAIIDPNDCNIPDPTLEDFPEDDQSQRQGEIFIYWVRLCAIIGRVAKALLQPNKSAPLPDVLREELIAWIHSLPPHLQIRIESAQTTDFDRDVHQLHLFYLTTIIVLHLKRSGGQLPQALPPAILAASCTARILRDILARGNSRFLMAITCWHIGTAFIALLQACRIPRLSTFANRDMDILSVAIKQLQTMWGSANVIAYGFDRLRNPSCQNVDSGHVGTGAPGGRQANPQSLDSYLARADIEVREGNGFDWMRFFPFVSKLTNGIADSLISGKEQGAATRGFPSPDNELFHNTLLAQYQDLFDPFIDYSVAFPDMSFPSASDSHASMG